MLPKMSLTSSGVIGGDEPRSAEGFMMPTTDADGSEAEPEPEPEPAGKECEIGWPEGEFHDHHQ